MGKLDQYRQQLRALEEWDQFLLDHSGLPGPRGNIELAQAVAEEGNEQLFARYRSYGPDRAPVNDPHEFLAFCGVLGLGRLLAAGRTELIDLVRQAASDPRWRVREAVAMALQRWGERDMQALLDEMRGWSGGSRLEQRAAAAALCEPRLLKGAETVKAVLAALDRTTETVVGADDRRSADFKALRKGLGYCWSVATAALPEHGLPLMERWMAVEDPDVRWIMVQNLKKARLARVAPDWVAEWSARLAGNG